MWKFLTLGRDLVAWTEAANLRFVTASSCPTASQTVSPGGGVAILHPTEKWVWGTAPADPHGGGHWLILYSSLIARKLHADNKLINCFDPDLVWTTWTEQVFPVTGVYGIPSPHLSHFSFV